MKTVSARSGAHKRQPSRVQGLLSSIRGHTDDNDAFDEQSTRQLMTAVHGDSEDGEDETLLDSSSDDDDDEPRSPTSSYGSITDSHFSGRPSQRRRHKCSWCSTEQLCRILHAILHSFLVYLGLPLFATALILYYGLNNPELDFLPGDAKLSWWCNFLGRQVVTLELSRLTQWIVLDLLVLGTRGAARVLGPHVTFFAIHARGWPLFCVRRRSGT